MPLLGAGARGGGVGADATASDAAARTDSSRVVDGERSQKQADGPLTHEQPG